MFYFPLVLQYLTGLPFYYNLACIFDMLVLLFVVFYSFASGRHSVIVT